MDNLMQLDLFRRGIRPRLELFGVRNPTDDEVFELNRLSNEFAYNDLKNREGVLINYLENNKLDSMTAYTKQFNYRGYSFSIELNISDDKKAFEILCKSTGVDTYAIIFEGEGLSELETKIILAEKRMKDYVDLKLNGKESLEDRLLKLGFNGQN
jgi:hypothetical protein